MNSGPANMLNRTLDITAAGIGLVLISPLLALIGLSIWACMGRPVFFRQRRPGYRGRIFTVVKFRTMINAYDRDGRPLSDRTRITWLGRLLRRTSLDELPQLLNVLSGEMSLVGPRPLLPEYLNRYTPQQARRHEVQPGITGLAQIRGRNALGWGERLSLDVWYVDHQSLRLDLQILLHTAVRLVRHDTVSADGDLDVPPFTGSASDEHAAGDAAAMQEWQTPRSVR
jgi:lipopolysaccharide/colanic/teichoic acid biosynthesis glycosyltransferase